MAVVPHSSLPSSPNGAATPRLRQPLADDPTDYEHRHFVNLLAAAFLLSIGIATVWTVEAMDEYEKERMCVEAGRRNCAELDIPQHWGVRLLGRR